MYICIYQLEPRPPREGVGSARHRRAGVRIRAASAKSGRRRYRCRV